MARHDKDKDIKAAIEQATTCMGDMVGHKDLECHTVILLTPSKVSIRGTTASVADTILNMKATTVHGICADHIMFFSGQDQLTHFPGASHHGARKIILPGQPGHLIQQS